MPIRRFPPILTGIHPNLSARPHVKTPPFSTSRHRFPATLLFAAALLASPLPAQRMTVSDRNATPVVVESAAISTEVTGRIAVTTFDLVFRNPNSRVLEGSFEFPLLEGQSVVRFALDINGRLREAVPVQKDRGRVVFEEIERRGIDPGLLEQTAGNNYRARVYPIPANGTRRVVLAYQEDLARGPAGPAYRLALDFKETLKKFHLSVTVQTAEKTPAMAHTTLPLELPEWQNARLLEIERTDFSARGVLDLVLPRPESPRTITERRGDNEYFYAEVPAIAAARIPRPAPKAVGLLWDASGSGRQRDHAKEFKLLDAWFAAVPNTEVRLVELRDVASAPATFKVKNGDWSALRQALENTIYDGATSFDGLADDPKVEEWLLFSDGLVNYGTTQSAAKLPLHGAVHAVLACNQANPAFLRGLAQRGAGEFVNLTDTDPAAAAAQLRGQSLRILSVERNPEQIAQVFPEVNTPVSDGALVVTGMLKVPTAAIRVVIGHDAADARTLELTVRSGENPSQLAARAWATTKIALLSTDLAANKEDIRRTSEEFGIVSADSSLIVLETLADYLRYDITPPEELRAEWDAHRRTADEGRRKDLNAHIEGIVPLFEGKVAWWKKAFPKDAPPVSQESSKKDGIARFALADASRRSEREARPAAARALTPAPAADSAGDAVALSPFVVNAAPESGYRASNTLAGSRGRGGAAIDLPTVSAAESTGSAADRSVTAASISLQRWEAKAGYLDHLGRAEPAGRYGVYLEERSAHARQPGFFLDVAEFFFTAKENGLALRVLSNLAELQLEDPALLRVLAHRLVQAGRPELALPLFEQVLKIRPDEPQSYRDLALVCATLKQNQRAVDLLWQVVQKPWDARFPEIELIALGELNAIAATSGGKLDLAKVDARLRQNLPVGLRVILTWDANDCDIDLWVDDPNGEQARYDHPLTYQGGRMSRDFTQGYGPEEFILREPNAGKYTVRINYYGDRRQTALGPVTAQVRLITGYGTPAEKEQRLTVRLTDNKETLEIGAIEIGGK